METADKTGLPLRKILFAGLIAGSLDIIAAFIDAWFTFHSTPDKVLNGIAGGAIGKDNVPGSSHGMLFGLLVHFFIAVSYTFFLYFIYPVLKNALKSNILIGILYGLFIWATMRLLVLSLLSQVKFAPFNIIRVFKPMLIQIGALGLPLAFIIPKIISVKAKEKELLTKSTTL